MNEGRSYVPPVGLGEVMRAYAAGHVVASRHPDFGPGDAVVGLFGVQSHPVVDATLALRVDTGQAPLERWIGGLGMPGWTAYFGLLEVGKDLMRRWRESQLRADAAGDRGCAQPSRAS